MEQIEATGLIDVQLAHAKRLCNDIAWTHKIHEKQADIYREKGLLFQWISALCIALSSLGAATSFVFNEFCLQPATAAISAVALLVTIARDMRSYELLSRDHSDFAKTYLVLRNKAYEIYDRVALADLDQEDELAQLEESYQSVNKSAPRTAKRAVKHAERAKRDGEFQTIGSERQPSTREH